MNFQRRPSVLFGIRRNDVVIVWYESIMSIQIQFLELHAAAFQLPKLEFPCTHYQRGLTLIMNDYHRGQSLGGVDAHILHINDKISLGIF